jgi:hypothetical protein
MSEEFTSTDSCVMPYSRVLFSKRGARLSPRFGLLLTSMSVESFCILTHAFAPFSEHSFYSMAMILHTQQSQHFLPAEHFSLNLRLFPVFN